MTARMRALFVDDSELALRALRQGLRPEAKWWEMHFALGGREGLRALTHLDVDVLVTALEMCDVDGPVLLRRIHPGTRPYLRLALTSQSDAACPAEADAALARPYDIVLLRQVLQSVRRAVLGVHRGR